VTDVNQGNGDREDGLEQVFAALLLRLLFLDHPLEGNYIVEVHCAVIIEVERSGILLHRFTIDVEAKEEQRSIVSELAVAN